ncbi:predicted protein [Aspergillus terreus NIH2624]|uniref:Uncharacterized protein n=1 Tax=Aspergillus terreus (strain NIH 2624 / FGSC A1156) TaxID=341663 RepID=Q0CJN7_ASPTN|nr:uncharacterized protein ATEG_06097 [Aspergillus terreus NIH2624]EAU33858.1 predicted protein [Aspergillus terreus NIH2624]
MLLYRIVFVHVLLSVWFFSPVVATTEEQLNGQTAQILTQLSSLQHTAVLRAGNHGAPERRAFKIDPIGGVTRNPLTDLGSLLQGVTGTLSPTLIEDALSVIHHMAYLGAQPTSPQTKHLIEVGFDLRKQGLLDEVMGLLDNASELLTPGVVDDANVLLDRIGPLVTEANMKKITGLVETANTLLTPEFNKEVKVLIGSVEEALPADKIDDLKALVHATNEALLPDGMKQISALLENAKELLTHDMLQEIQCLISRAGKLVTNDNLDKIESLLTGAGQLLTAQTVRQLKTALDDVGDLDIDQLKTLPDLIDIGISLLTEDAVDQIRGLVNNVGILVQDGSLPNIKPLVQNGYALLTPEFSKDVEALINAAGSLVKDMPELMDQVQDMFKNAAPILESELRKEITNLIVNGKVLLTPAGARDIRRLMHTVSNGLSPYMLGRVKTLLTMVEGLLTENRIKQLGNLIDGVATNLTPKLRTLPSLLDNAGGLLTEAGVQHISDLLEAVAPMVTPELLQEVQALLKYASGLLTEERVDLTRNLISNASKLVSMLVDFLKNIPVIDIDIHISDMK